MSSLGGVGKVQPANKDIMTMVLKVKTHVETKLGQQYHCFRAISFRQQLVNGINYFVKVKVGEGEYVHLRIYQDFKKTITRLDAVQAHKSEDSTIEFFDIDPSLSH
ncbi:cystatin A3 [Cavenderia fasciculata]|uniref:Cystatin A3 n=1 Tax=Cavenderia fasciculata TaxID=261658 RepID=F4PM12_CACFS|nr:cystatin A3 [Cavenderia fasciculata]EGG22715.1 cystatin A3 [Cavenderia fasciculata]|eukprot:XP_004360566.1 cystatin A3 [Cavenderia fasciculata]